MNSKRILAFGAHPDDVELAAGGTVAKAARDGLEVVIVDMTDGGLGTRGNGEIRTTEAAEAAKILGVSERKNLGLPDGSLAVNDESITKVIEVLRHFRPETVLMPPAFERHPDHEAANRIVRTAMFKSGLAKVETFYNDVLQDRFRIRKMFCYMMSYDFQKRPDFFIDISDTFPVKMEAIRAYKSQVYNPGTLDNGLITRLSRPEFLEELEARAVYFGTQIGVKYAEAFYSVESLGLSSLVNLIY